MGGGDGKHDDSLGGEGGGTSNGRGGSGACSSPLESPAPWTNVSAPLRDWISHASAVEQLGNWSKLSGGERHVQVRATSPAAAAYLTR